MQRKLQRQHTKRCLQQALTFAIGAKRSCRELQSKGVIARDLEQFRESLYKGADGGHVGMVSNGGDFRGSGNEWNEWYSGQDKFYDDAGPQQSCVVVYK